MIDERGTTGFQDIPVGAEVFTSDGDKLGDVKEVQQGSFNVNAAMQPDYWLPTSTVASTAVNRVTLNFPKDRLDDYKRNEPLVA
jgi:Uncharacterized protein conserved in bacteria (DUF2171)